MKDKNIILEEILVFISNIWKFLEHKNKRGLLKDHKTCSAIVLQLIIIGENAKKLDEKVKSEINLPWRDIMGFRNRAIHEYGNIDRDIVVSVVFGELSEMEKQIKKYLKNQKNLKK